MSPILQVLFDPILAVFAILALGFVMGRSGTVDLSDAQAINRFAMTVLLPVFVFDVIAHAPIRSFSFLPLALYALIEAVVFAIGYMIARRLFARDQDEAILLGLTGIFVNNALYILPISILLYGKGGALPITAIVTLDSIVVFGCAMVALQGLKMGQASPGRIVISVLRMPMIIGLLLGIVFGWMAIDLPAPIETFLSFNGSAAGPVALFALGAALSRTQFERSALVAVFVTIKLLIFPVLVWLAMNLFAAERPETEHFILSAAGPSGAMAFSLALLYGVPSQAIAQIIVWTSLLSLLSLAVLA